MLQSVYDTVTLIGSLLLIVLILVATYFATRWYARRMQGGAGKHMRILERTPLGVKSSLVIVQVGERYFLIGAGEKSIDLLSELPELADQIPPAPEQPDLPIPKAFREMLDKAKGRLEKKEDDGGTR